MKNKGVCVRIIYVLFIYHIEQYYIYLLITARCAPSMSMTRLYIRQCHHGRNTTTDRAITSALLRLECSIDCISGSVGHHQNLFPHILKKIKFLKTKLITKM